MLWVVAGHGYCHLRSTGEWGIQSYKQGSRWVTGTAMCRVPTHRRGKWVVQSCKNGYRGRAYQAVSVHDDAVERRGGLRAEAYTRPLFGSR